MPFSNRAARHLALGLLLALGSALPVVAQSKEEKKAMEAQQQSARTLFRVVDGLHAAKLAAGGYTIKAGGKDDAVASAADALELAWRHDAFKAVQGKIYVPFTISYEANKSLPNNITMLVRAVKKGTPIAKDPEKTPYEFEQLFTGDALPSAAGKPVELTRRIVVPAGDVEVYVAVQPAPGIEPRKGDVLVKGVARKFDLNLPDFWNGELTTSSMLLIDKIEPLKEAPTQDTIVFKPYTFTGADMSLARDVEFKKAEELTLYFHVYNPTLENKRPDVSVEYEFLKKEADGDKPAMTEDGKKLVYNAQKYNAQTLPAQWDPELGFQVAPGFAIPLNLFPLGEYRISIKITDNKAQKTITREVGFKVVG
jgi:hypothetical protein